MVSPAEKVGKGMSGLALSIRNVAENIMSNVHKREFRVLPVIICFREKENT